MKYLRVYVIDIYGTHDRVTSILNLVTVRGSVLLHLLNRSPINEFITDITDDDNDNDDDNDMCIE